MEEQLVALGIQRSLIVEKRDICRDGDDDILLGSGRFGVVVRARHATHGECVIKMLHRKLLPVEGGRASRNKLPQNFVTECNMGHYISKYKLRDFVHHFGVTMVNDLPCLIMEKVAYTLHDFLQDNRNDGVKCRIAYGIACGLRDLHLLKITHCLLECHSVLVTSAGEAKITNLGEANRYPTKKGYTEDKSSLSKLLLEIDTGNCGKCSTGKPTDVSGRRTSLSRIADNCESQELPMICTQLEHLQEAETPSHSDTHAHLPLEGPGPVS